MLLWLDDSNLRLLALVDLLLVLLMITVGNYTSMLRIQRKVFATPEDYARRGLPLRAPDEGVERTRRVHLNHVENVLPFFVVSLLYALTQPSHLMLSIFMWGFLIARVAYSVFYLRAMQPHRTLAFSLGIMCTLGITILTLAAVVKAY